MAIERIEKKEMADQDSKVREKSQGRAWGREASAPGPALVGG